MARLILGLERPDDYRQESHKRYNKVSRHARQYQPGRRDLRRRRLWWYAQARSSVAVEVDSSTYIGNLVFRGEPSTMG
ncbi:hypothetical protein ACWDNI_31620 [Nocardia niigatensis]